MGTVRTLQLKDITDLGIIFRISGVQRDGLQVESTIQIHCGDNVLEGWNNTLYGGDVLLFESQRGGRSGYDGLDGRPVDYINGGLSGGLRGCRGRRGPRKG